MLGVRDTDIYAVVLLVFQFMHQTGVVGPSPAVGHVAVLIVAETEDNNKIPRSQYKAMYGTAKGSVRDWCASHCEPNGFQLIDKDAGVSRDAQWAQDAFAKFKEDSGGKVPWLVVIHPSTTFSGPLPDTTADTLAVLQRYGGK